MSKPTCSHEGCARESKVRGLCQRHYANAWYNGTIAINRREPTAEARFWGKVEKSQGCWLWRGGQGRGGYGRAHIGGTEYRPAHRVAYELVVGPIPDSFDLDHLCRVRLCVNPSHLEPVTNRENTLRGYGPTAINARKTHCLRGHPLSGDNLVRLRSSDERKCRTCHRDRVRAHDAIRRAR